MAPADFLTHARKMHSSDPIIERIQSIATAHLSNTVVPSIFERVARLYLKNRQFNCRMKSTYSYPRFLEFVVKHKSQYRLIPL